MLTVREYRVEAVVAMPKGARILTASLRRDLYPPHVSLWALVDTDQAPEDRYFRLYSADYPLTEGYEHRWVGMVQETTSWPACHIFECVDRR